MNSSAPLMARARLWRRSKPIVEVVLRSRPEPPQSEPPRCPGQTSTSSSRVKQPLVQRAEERGGARPWLDRQIGASNVADEQRVSAE